MKKAVACLLAAVLLITGIPVTSLAEGESGTNGSGFSFHASRTEADTYEPVLLTFELDRTVPYARVDVTVVNDTTEDMISSQSFEAWESNVIYGSYRFEDYTPAGRYRFYVADGEWTIDDTAPSDAIPGLSELDPVYVTYRGPEHTAEVSVELDPVSDIPDCGSNVTAEVFVNGSPAPVTDVFMSLGYETETDTEWLDNYQTKTDLTGHVYLHLVDATTRNGGHYRIACTDPMTGAEATAVFSSLRHSYSGGQCSYCGAIDPDYVFPNRILSITADRSTADSNEPIGITLTFDSAPQCDRVNALIEVINPDGNSVTDLWIDGGLSDTITGNMFFRPEMALEAGIYSFRVRKVYGYFYDPEYQEIILTKPEESPETSIYYNGYESVVQYRLTLDALPDPLHCGDFVSLRLTKDGAPLAGESLNVYVYYSADDGLNWLSGDTYSTDENGCVSVSIRAADPTKDYELIIEANADRYGLYERFSGIVPVHTYRDGFCVCGAVDPDFDDFPFAIESFTADRTDVKSSQPMQLKLVLDGVPETSFHAEVKLFDPEGNEVDRMDLYPGPVPGVLEGSYVFRKDHCWEAGDYTFRVSFVGERDASSQCIVADPKGAEDLTVAYQGYESEAEVKLEIAPIEGTLRCGDDLAAVFTIDGAPVSDATMEINLYYGSGDDRVWVNSTSQLTDENGRVSLMFMAYEGHLDDRYALFAVCPDYSVYASLALPVPEHVIHGGLCTYCGAISDDYVYPHRIQSAKLNQTVFSSGEIISLMILPDDGESEFNFEAELVNENGESVMMLYGDGSGRAIANAAILPDYNLPAGNYTIRIIRVGEYAEIEPNYWNWRPAIDPATIGTFPITYLGPESNKAYTIRISTPNEDDSVRCGDRVTAEVLFDGTPAPMIQLDYELRNNENGYMWDNLVTDENGKASFQFLAPQDMTGAVSLAVTIRGTNQTEVIAFSSAEHRYEFGSCTNCGAQDPDFDDYPFEVESYGLTRDSVRYGSLIPLDLVLRKTDDFVVTNAWVSMHLEGMDRYEHIESAFDVQTGRVYAKFKFEEGSLDPGTYQIVIDDVYAYGRLPEMSESRSFRALKTELLEPLSISLLPGDTVFEASLVDDSTFECGETGEILITADGQPYAFSELTAVFFFNGIDYRYEPLRTDENGKVRAEIFGYEQEEASGTYELRLSEIGESLPFTIFDHHYNEAGLCECGKSDPEFTAYPFTIEDFRLTRGKVALYETMEVILTLSGSSPVNYTYAQFELQSEDNRKNLFTADLNTLGEFRLNLGTWLDSADPGIYTVRPKGIYYSWFDSDGMYKRGLAADPESVEPLTFEYVGDYGNSYEIHVTQESDDSVAHCMEPVTITVTSSGIPAAGVSVSVEMLHSEGYCYESQYYTTNAFGEVQYRMVIPAGRIEAGDDQFVRMRVKAGNEEVTLDFDATEHEGDPFCPVCRQRSGIVSSFVYDVDLLEVDRTSIHKGEAVTVRARLLPVGSAPLSGVPVYFTAEGDEFFASNTRITDENGEVTAKLPFAAVTAADHSRFSIKVEPGPDTGVSINPYDALEVTYLGAPETPETYHGTLTVTPETLKEGETIRFIATVFDENDQPVKNAVVTFYVSGKNYRGRGWTGITDEEGTAKAGYALYEDYYDPAGDYTVQAYVFDQLIDEKTYRFVGASNGLIAGGDGLAEVSGSAFETDENGVTINAATALGSPEGVRIASSDLQEVLNAIRGTEKRFTVILQAMTVSFDATALSSIVQAAGDADVEIRGHRMGIYELNAMEIGGMETGLRYVPMHFAVTNDGTAITDLGGGNAEVSIPFLPEDSTDVLSVRLYDRGESGLEALPDAIRYENASLRFETDKAADFVISVNWNLLYGDTTSDAVFDAEDAVYALYALYFPEAYPANQRLDFNHDGYESEDDVLYMAYALAFPDLYPMEKE